MIDNCQWEWIRNLKLVKSNISIWNHVPSAVVEVLKFALKSPLQHLRHMFGGHWNAKTGSFLVDLPSLKLPFDQSGLYAIETISKWAFQHDGAVILSPQFPISFPLLSFFSRTLPCRSCFVHWCHTSVSLRFGRVATTVSNMPTECRLSSPRSTSSTTSLGELSRRFSTRGCHSTKEPASSNDGLTLLRLPFVS